MVVDTCALRFHRTSGLCCGMVHKREDVSSSPNAAPYSHSIRCHNTSLCGLKIVSNFTGAWQALMAWRCSFIELEKSGLRCSELSRQISLKIPAFQWSMTTLLINLILLLNWPAQLASPVLSGAISWVPTLNMTTLNTTLLRYP
jgi:hypothetical protein